MPLLQACKKDDPQPSSNNSNPPAACQTNNTATLTITNQSSNTYRVTYDGTRVTDVFANTSQDVTVRGGNASVRAIQQTNVISGYGAADLTLPYSVASCSTATVTISPECSTIGFGEVTFINRSSNPYRIAVNGTDAFDLAGGRQATYYLRSGNQALRATQISGFLVFPTVVNQTVNMTNCGTFSFVFP